MKRYVIALLAILVVVAGYFLVENWLKSKKENEEKLKEEVLLKNLPPELLAILPPDPGEAGKATLEGIDSDSDGVRDDVQRYIILTYQYSESLRLALLQVARQMQLAIVSSSSPASMTGSAECLYYIATTKNLSASSLYNPLVSLQINTGARYLAYKNRNNEIFTYSPSENLAESCPFDISTLEN